jgi:hypothetical protein
MGGGCESLRMWVTVHLERIYISLSSEVWVPQFATERRACAVWLPLRNHPPVAWQVGPTVSYLLSVTILACLRCDAVWLLATFRRKLLLSPPTEGRLKVLAKHNWSCGTSQKTCALPCREKLRIYFFYFVELGARSSSLPDDFVFDSCTRNGIGSGFCPNSFGFTPLTTIPPLLCTNILGVLHRVGFRGFACQSVIKGQHLTLGQD